MKIFWLISFLFTLAFGINSQIITGAYTLERSALAEVKKLQKFIEKDKDFFEKNLIVVNHKKNGNYYLVTLEPFTDPKISAAALKKIQTKYKLAYILNLPDKETETSFAEPKKAEESVVSPIEIASVEINNTIEKENPIIIEEPLLVEENATLKTQIQETNLIKEETSVTEVKVPLAEEKTVVKKEESAEKKEAPYDSQKIILVFLVVAVLLILFFFLRRSAKKDTQDNKDIFETKHELKEIIIDEVKADESDFDELHGLEEGYFNLPEDEKEIQDFDKNLKKRTLPVHDKIVKKDFQEFAGARILVAEDNLINQKVITGLLGDSGIEVVVANNGKEALEVLAKESNFTIILMDAHMPIMDGFEATRAIRKNPQYDHIAIVALSGDISNSDIKKMFNAGMDEHLEKPLRIDALYDVLYVYTDYKTENRVNELNIEKGLETCSGDESFYHEILDEFITTYADSDTKIFKYLDEGQLILADKYLLDLIGITSHVGADNLNAIAKKIKEALKDADEKSYVTLAHQYSELLHKLIQSIHEYK